MIQIVDLCRGPAQVKSGSLGLSPNCLPLAPSSRQPWSGEGGNGALESGARRRCGADKRPRAPTCSQPTTCLYEDLESKCPLLARRDPTLRAQFADPSKSCELVAGNYSGSIPVNEPLGAHCRNTPG